MHLLDFAMFARIITIEPCTVLTMKIRPATRVLGTTARAKMEAAEWELQTLSKTMPLAECGSCLIMQQKTIKLLRLKCTGECPYGQH